MTGGLVRGGKLNKTDEMERRRGRFNWLLFFFLNFLSFFSQVEFSFRHFCLINCVLVSVSLIVSPVVCDWWSGRGGGED